VGGTTPLDDRGLHPRRIRRVGNTQPGQPELDRYDPEVTIRVTVAEDSLLVREGIAKLLALEPDLEITELCEDLDQLMASVEQDVPDVVVTDIRMPPSGTDEGIRAATALREQHPSVGVVVLSQYVDPAYAMALLDTGSEGRAYLLKERVSDGAELAAAVRTVAGGGSVIDPKVVEVLVSARSRSSASPLRFLTPRELEVLSEIARGKNNAAVAASLGLSERAVEKHINSLFAKLGLTEEPDLHRRVMAVLLYLADKPPD
jgi:DNA-binding NarL/FixJ family response regulator